MNDGTLTQSSNNPQSSQSSTQNGSAATATTTTTSAISNPYVVRQQPSRQPGQRSVVVHKRPMGNRIISPEEQERQLEVLPLTMHIWERFFAAVLRSLPSEYLIASSTTKHHHNNGGASSSSQQRQTDDDDDDLWRVLCRRVQLDVLAEPLPAVYDDSRHYTHTRAALVLEEARHSLTSGLEQTWNRRSGNAAPASSSSSSSSSMILRVHRIEGKGNSHSKVELRKIGPTFSKEELFHLRPGQVLECMARDGPRSIQNAIWGVVGSSSREKIEKKQCFEILVCNALPKKMEGSDFVVSPIASLINEFRCFEAMFCDTTRRLGLLQCLLGDPGMITTTNENDNKKAAAPSIRDYFQPLSSSNQPAAQFRLPALNATQERAASSFLNSNAELVLVQGPPGTGKTSLTVNVMCRYIVSQQQKESDGSSTRRRRLMVCAPTNKAVTVLATRFLASMTADCQCNTILVGDSDKLLGDEKSERNPHAIPSAESAQLKAIYLYSWMDTIKAEFRKILIYFRPQADQRDWTTERLHAVAVKLERRLVNGLKGGLPDDVKTLLSKITGALWQLKNGGAAHDIELMLTKLLEGLSNITNDGIWRQLVKTADVIFCTLSSAGGLIFKNTLEIDDLIVDEAAAATEPELCIPFHLKPKRMLLVGDPLQLPATVLSRKAVELGLARSLHERLMFECDYEHIMLDVQYRMRPEISSFPSARFYDSRIANGENVQRPDYRSQNQLFGGRAYTFFHVSGMEEQGPGGSFRNPMEAKAIIDLVLQLQSQAQLVPTEKAKWHSMDRLRIITFYQAQVQLLKRLLRENNLGDKVLVATVDSSQGCEANIVIVSFVRSQVVDTLTQNSHRTAAGFLTDDRRMNVSLTRARHQLVCVGNVNQMKSLEGADTLQLLAQDAKARHVIHTSLSERPRNMHDDHAPPTSQLDLFYGTASSEHRPPSKRTRLDHLPPRGRS